MGKLNPVVKPRVAKIAGFFLRDVCEAGSMLTDPMHTYHFGSSGLTHWKIRSVIREVEYASLCNNSSPDDCSCLKFFLEDAKVHRVILHRSKICMLNRKRVLKIQSVFYHFTAQQT